MNLPNIYERILNDSKLKKQLTKLADFELIKPIIDIKKIKIRSTEKLILIAKDGSGGHFALWDDGKELEKCSVVYIGSEGQSGIIAETFDDAISLFLAYLTNWHSFYLTENEEKNKKRKNVIEGFVSEQFEYDPDLKSIKEELIQQLSIEPMSDPFSYLQKIARCEGPEITSLYGEKYRNVFEAPED